MGGASKAGAAVSTAAAIVMTSVLTVTTVVPARAASRPASSPMRLGPGLTYERITDRTGPVVVHVVRLDPLQATTVDLGAGGPTMGSFSRPSAIGRAHGAVIAINGDFGLLDGYPVHPFMMDGLLMGRGVQNGTSFAVAHDETTAFVGPPHPVVDGLLEAGNVGFPVSGWNSHRPAEEGIAAFTRYGGSIHRPPDSGCAARLDADGPLGWAALEAGVSRRYTVDVVRCVSPPRRVEPRGVVLASRRWGEGADAIEAMQPGDRVRLSWSVGWPRVLDTIGGMPHLVDEGASVAPRCRVSFCRRHPRTGIGVTSDGTLLLVVVDGRSRRSVGMTLRRFARTFLSLGAVEAMNLDGGGSSVMWIRGRGVVSSPSDPGGERSVVNALLILPGADPGEQPLTGVGVDAAIGRASIGGPWSVTTGSLAATDAGSTGGLSAAWLEGALGSEPVSPALRRLGLSFRSGR
ncbi:MAG: phosphodiester glycosidase family protein [Actinomycetota bacterium]